MKSQTLIRRASLEDLKQLTRLFDLYRQFYEQKSDLLAAEDFLKNRLSNQESIIFVSTTVTDQDTITGFAQLYPVYTSIGLKKSWLLNDLFVDTSMRRSGTGEELIKAAISFSASTGARNLVLQTAKTNNMAQKLYEKMGWVKDEKFYAYYFFH